uniref:4-hydroxythreonine-4-phosphate dehydrogenase PdxA n=1 Tax=Marinobacterium profundum TaxID=1714300 RepID=UPI0008296D52|nr:4-hydroxythreonine-4-phosphate dehydrogenase PdxA [Marinobacterium profundum]
MTKKTIALLQGDPAGIGPELLIKLLADKTVRERANLLVIGDPRIFAQGEATVGSTIGNVRHLSDSQELTATDLDFGDGAILHLDQNYAGIDEVPTATASAPGGASSVGSLHRSLELSRDGLIDAIVFMPFNKESMHLGGNAFNDELGYASQFFGLTTPASEFNVANGMWNGRVTSHVAMKDVPGLLSVERICDSITLAHDTLKLAGYDDPRIVVSAYNPHAGDNGLMGREEIDVIVPAVKKMKQQQVNVSGPLPADTLWLKVRDGEYDAAVTMYHDQGQIAIKLLGFDRGVSVLAGLPVAITTPAHGTAFDIAGQNKANVLPTLNAFTMAANTAERRKATDGVRASLDNAD